MSGLLRLLCFAAKGQAPGLASRREAGTGKPGPRYLDGPDGLVLYPARARGKRHAVAQGRKIRIRVGTVTAEATLNGTPTAERIWSALPLNAKASTWGDEIYFTIPVEAALEKDAKEVVQRGDLGYWPPETAFCIFFGPTPVSRGDEVRAASAVNVIGRVLGDPAVFKQVRSGTRITLEQA